MDFIQARNRLPVELVVSLAREVGSVLEHAHYRGFFHRDIKPENIMVLDGTRIKILDFGIAAERDRADLTPGQFVGTLNYAAPEQIQCQPIDERTDLYSLGLIMHEMLTGSPAITASTPNSILQIQRANAIPPPSQVDPSIPRVLDTVIMTLLQTDPRQRYPRATEFLADLEVCERRFKSLTFHSRSVYDFPELVAQFQEASTALEKRNLDQALALTEDLSKKATRAPEVFFMLGRIHVERGFVYAGIREYIKASAFDPENSFYHLSLGNAYTNLEMYAQAKGEYQQALQLDPRSAAAKAALAKLNQAGVEGPPPKVQTQGREEAVVPQPKPPATPALDTKLVTLVVADLRPPFISRLSIAGLSSVWWGWGFYTLGRLRTTIWATFFQLIAAGLGEILYKIHIEARHHKLPSDGRFWALANDVSLMKSVGFGFYGLGLFLFAAEAVRICGLLSQQGHVISEVDPSTRWMTVNIGSERGANTTTIFIIYEEEEPGTGRCRRVGCMLANEITEQTASGTFVADYKRPARIGHFAVAQATVRDGLVKPEEPAAHRFPTAEELERARTESTT